MIEIKDFKYLVLSEEGIENRYLRFKSLWQKVLHYHGNKKCLVKYYVNDIH